MNLDTFQFEVDLLGSIILNGLTLDAVEVIDKLPVDAFTDARTRELFGVMKKMSSSNEIMNMTTVTDEVMRNEMSNFSYAVADIADLCLGAHCSPAQYKSYAKRIRQAMYVRQTIKSLDEAKEKLLGNGNLSDVAEEVSTMLSGLTLETDRKLPRSLKEIAENYHEELEKRIAPSAINTPFPDMNKAQGRVNPEDLIILAARPAMGKTELAAAIADQVAKDKSVYFASMEMSDVQVFERLMAISGNYSGSLLRDFFNQDDSNQARALAQITEVSNRQVYIQDTANISLADIEKDIEYIKRRTGDLGLIVIDYFGLMKVSGQNRNQALGEVSRSLKQLAKRIKTPIILLSQLNRKLEERGDKRPIMSDLRETGDLEQDADQIIFIYRDEVYNPDSPFKGTAEVYWGKHRFGDLSKAKCMLTFRDGHFNNYAGPSYEDIEQENNPKQWTGGFN